MAKKMLIDATHPEETRVVVVDGQKVDDFDFESITKRQLAGNIYLAKVTRVEPSLQAAFVEYGGNRHGFLAFAEVHPDYYQIPVADREALLAEEEREEEARRAREEEDEGKPKRPRERKPRKERSRSRKKKEDTSEETAVAGLEVIDVVADGAEGDSPSGLEVADVIEAAPGGMEVTDVASDASDEVIDETVEIAVAPEAANTEEVAEPAPEATEGTEIVSATEAPAEAEPEPADDTVELAAAPEADIAEQDAVVAEAPEEDVPADAGTEDDTNEPAPKTIAESAGLEDDEAVTELVGEPSSAQTLTGDAAAEAVQEAQADTPAEEVSTDEAPADAAADSTPPDGAQDVVAEEDTSGTAADAASDATTADTGAEADAEAEAPKPKPKRRRSRRPKKDEAKADDPADDATNADEAKQNSGEKQDEAANDDSDGGADPDGDDDGADGEVDEVGAEDALEEVVKARSRLRRKYKIQDVIKVRQIMLVQVVKEERGNKGAALTTYLSLAGRYCVLMPNTARGGGISRKITNATDRKRLREVTSTMDVPKGMGLIVRTAGAERTKAEIKRDYEFLIRQWEQIRDLTLQSVAPTLIYEEGSLIKRSIRDVYSKEIDQVLVEGETGYREAKEYMKMLMPSHAKNVQPYTDQIPLFSRYQVDSYLNGMFNPTVQLRSGGYIVIGVTEALVAIDVNSGRATKQGSIEETALLTNLEAADEVARQARLRDLAGLIVIDFIDMDENRNNRAVEKRMKDRLKNDRARIQVGRISAFGLMEMSRQRLRPGMLEATTQPCPHCHGTGLIRSDENLSLSILREVEEEALRGRADEIIVRAPIDVANYLINRKRQHLAQLEQRHQITVAVMAVTDLMSPKFEIERSKTSTRQAPRVQDVVSATSVADEVVEEAEVLNDEQDDDDGRARRRRGKRGGRRKRGEGHETQGDENGQADASSSEARSSEPRSSEDGEEDGDGRSRGRRRRRRGGRGRRNNDDQLQNDEAQAEGASNEDQATADVVTDAEAQTSEAEPAADKTVDMASEPQTEVAETQAPAEEPVTEAVNAPADDVAEAEPEAAPEPEPEPEPELETAGAEAPASEAQPDETARPKRRGWWSFGRN